MTRIMLSAEILPPDPHKLFFPLVQYYKGNVQVFRGKLLLWTLLSHLTLGSWAQFNMCAYGGFPTPTGNSQTPSGCLRIQLNSDTTQR